MRADRMDNMQNENLGPAERILQTVLSHSGHAVHNRAGIAVTDTGSVVGSKWLPVTHVEENGDKIVYELRKVGRKSTKVKLGKLSNDGRVRDGRRVVGKYQPAGLYPDVVEWVYKQVAEVWNLDNEFAAKWASYAYGQEHRDLKVILAAFMLVQTRKGDPVLDKGKVAFLDEDYRDVGEAMFLITTKGKDGKVSFNPKLLMRVHDVLSLPAVAKINRDLGFGKSARKPFLGRWPKAVEKWLRYREENPKMLEGLVNAGFRRTVMDLARKVGYKPNTGKFFETLRWKQAQSKEGHRSIAIGQEVKAAESWEGLTEEQICEKITQDRPNWKRVVGLLPKDGVTRAVMAAAIEVGSLSNKDLIIATPTLEELGLLDVQDIRVRWETAVKEAEDMRAANIAQRVKSKKTQEKLSEAADNAVKKAVAEVLNSQRIYFCVDVSSSMHKAIPTAKRYLTQFLQGFPLERTHVSVFNTSGRVVKIKQNSSAGVEQAFRGFRAGGGTDYGAGVRVLQSFKPEDDEDVIFIFVGDEEAYDFSDSVRSSGLNPVAFGFLKVGGTRGYTAVQDTAANLGIPCFMIDEGIFADPYAIPRTIRDLIAATPVGKASRKAAAPRVSLVDLILNTELLTKPAWAA